MLKWIISDGINDTPIAVDVQLQRTKFLVKKLIDLEPDHPNPTPHDEKDLVAVAKLSVQSSAPPKFL